MLEEKAPVGFFGTGFAAGANGKCVTSCPGIADLLGQEQSGALGDLRRASCAGDAVAKNGVPPAGVGQGACTLDQPHAEVRPRPWAGRVADRQRLPALQPLAGADRDQWLRVLEAGVEQP